MFPSQAGACPMPTGGWALASPCVWSALAMEANDKKFGSLPVPLRAPPHVWRARTETPGCHIRIVSVSAGSSAGWASTPSATPPGGSLSHSWWWGRQDGRHRFLSSQPLSPRDRLHVPHGMCLSRTSEGKAEVEKGQDGLEDCSLPCHQTLDVLPTLPADGPLQPHSISLPSLGWGREGHVPFWEVGAGSLSHPSPSRGSPPLPTSEQHLDPEHSRSNPVSFVC